MRKLIASIILFVIVATLATTVVRATTASTLADDLYKVGAKYGMTSAHKVKIERYVSDNNVTNSQAEQVIAKANEAVKIMEEAGTTDFNKLTAEQKNKIKTIANEAASIVGLTLTFKNGTVEIYKDGKRIEALSLNSGKLAYTGNNVNLVLVVSSVVVALAAGFTIRKKFANA
ncbi:MAG: hypothetical protein HFJ36_02420 [Clostridia bacterium]|nr:hypothetical protein [Clostridia bacterium]